MKRLSRIALLPLILLTLALPVLIGALMWVFERRRRLAANPNERAVTSLSDGIYWAAVTMTTVGYGDVTPLTPVGRFIAVIWMLGSLTLISLLTTSLVSRMTADAVTSAPIARISDLDGKRLAVVADSSGAEYLDEQHLHYTRYANLKEALASLEGGKSDAVVNSVGALQYAISTYFPGPSRCRAAYWPPPTWRSRCRRILRSRRPSTAR